MKGKVSVYFNAPNVSKVRSRVENPAEDFSSSIRKDIQDVTVEVLNEAMQSLRAKLIYKFEEKGLTVKSAAQAAALANPLNAFFDVVYSATPFANVETTEEATAEPENDGFDE